MTPPLIEVCVEGVAGAQAAARAGADRIELCAALTEGGVTAGPGSLQLVCARSTVPVVALIRSRAGDFCYTTDEIEVMAADIDAAAAAGAAAIAIGALRPDGSIDRPACERWISRTRPMSVTFHRAFDLTADPLAAYEALRELGVDRVLTSGQRSSALDGAGLLRELVARSASGGPTVVAAGGIRPGNLRKVIEATGARELHFAARTTRVSPMRHHNPHCPMAGPDTTANDERVETDEHMVREAVRLARQIDHAP